MIQPENTTLTSDCLTAPQGFEKFFTPPRKSPTEQEQKFEEQANIFIIPAKPAELIDP